MISHGAGRKFYAVADKVILLRGYGERVYFARNGLPQRFRAAAGHGERIVTEFKLAGLFAYFIHREIDHPAKFIAFLVHMTGYQRTEHFAHDSGGFLRGRLFARSYADKRSRSEAERFNYSIVVRSHELGDASGEAAVRLHLEPIGLEAGLHLNIGAQLVYMLSGQLASAAGYRLNAVPFSKRRKFAARNKLSYILHPQIYAVIRLVRTELLQRVVIGYALKRRGGGHIVRSVFCKNGRQNVLYYGENILLRGKGHFHIQLIEFAGASVPAGVFVTEAGGNLEIPIEAGGHQKLLKLLRRLRQGIELAGVLPCGHKIVPCAFGAGCCKYRRGYFKEVMFKHGLPERSYNVATQNYIVLDFGIPQIKITVFEPLRFIRFAAAVYFKGQLVINAAAQYLYLFGYDLYFAGGLLGVLACALAHGTGNGDGGFLIDALYNVHHLFGFYDYLRCAVKIAQHHKGEVAAHYADVFHPARKRNALVHVAEPKLAAGMGS